MNHIADTDRDAFDEVDPIGAGRDRRGLRRERPGFDGGRDDRFERDPLSGGGGGGGEDFGAASGPRRTRRATIVDDALDAPDAERKRPAAATKARRGGEERAARGGRAAERRAPADERRGAPTWAVTLVLCLMWAAGVLAFTAGALGLPLEDPARVVAGVGALPPAQITMLAAVTLAPIALIVMGGVAASRARALALETRRLQRLVNELSTAPGRSSGALGADVDPGALRSEAEAASRAIGALEESLEAAEERARLARDRLESERAALADVANGFERSAEQLSQSIAMVTGGGGRSEGAAAFAQLVAEALRDGGAGFATAPAAQSRAAAAAYENGRADARAFDQGADAPSPASARGFDAGDDLGDDFEADRFARDEFADAPAAPAPERGGEAASGAAGALDWSRLVRAANFPDSEDDRETLEALYAVLTDRDAAAFLQSAEDALSALADIGLFMEDMTPTHGPVEIWRSFILHGDHRDAMELGGIRNPHAIEDVMTALRERPDFADTAERFLDRYEGVVTRLFGEAPAASMAVELADTRSGRAYMLIGRAAGRFG